MPTGSYDGVAGEGVGSSCSARGGGEHDICDGRLMDLYSALYGVVSRVAVYHSHLNLSPPQLFPGLVQTGELVVGRHQS